MICSKTTESRDSSRRPDNPSRRLGSSVALFGNELRAPHGGIFVFPLVTNTLLYVVAILVGTAVTAGLVVVLKGLGAKK